MIRRVTEPVWRIQCDECHETTTIVGKSLHAALNLVDGLGWVRRVTSSDPTAPMLTYCDRCDAARKRTPELRRPAGAPR